MQVNISKIRGLMAEHGDTQKSLAEKLDVSERTVWNYLTGKTSMRVDEIAKIAAIYEVEPLTLFKTE